MPSKRAKCVEGSSWDPIPSHKKSRKSANLPTALYQDSPYSPAPPGLQDHTPTIERVKE